MNCQPCVGDIRAIWVSRFHELVARDGHSVEAGMPTVEFPLGKSILLCNRKNQMSRRKSISDHCYIVRANPILIFSLEFTYDRPFFSLSNMNSVENMVVAPLSSSPKDFSF